MERTRTEDWRINTNNLATRVRRLRNEYAAKDDKLKEKYTKQIDKKKDQLTAKYNRQTPPYIVKRFRNWQNEQFIKYYREEARLFGHFITKIIQEIEQATS